MAQVKVSISPAYLKAGSQRLDNRIEDLWGYLAKMKGARDAALAVWETENGEVEGYFERHFDSGIETLGKDLVKLRAGAETLKLIGAAYEQMQQEIAAIYTGEFWS